MDVPAVDDPADAGLNPGADLTRDRGYDGGTLKNRSCQGACDPGFLQQGRIHAMDGQYQRSSSGSRESGWYPTVGVDQVGAGADFLAGRCPHGAPQAAQREQPHGASQRRSERIIPRDRVSDGATYAHPIDGNAVNFHFP
jgi:hypothetical protein